MEILVVVQTEKEKSLSSVSGQVSKIFSEFSELCFAHFLNSWLDLFFTSNKLSIFHERTDSISFVGEFRFYLPSHFLAEL